MENAGHTFCYFFAMFSKSFFSTALNPLPHMPISGSSNSAANKNMISKLWTNGVQLSD